MIQHWLLPGTYVALAGIFFPLLLSAQMQYTGTDSVSNTRWEITNIRMTFGDREGNDSAFADYDKRVYALDAPDSITVIVCGELLPLFVQYATDKNRNHPRIAAVFKIKKSNLINFGESFDVLSSCSYKRGLKHGREYAYYHWTELKGVCISGNFMLKSKGQWKKGEKTGKWTEYDVTGKVIRVTQY